MFIFFFKQKTAYEMRISDWSSDVCSSDLSALTTSTPPGRFSISERASSVALWAVTMMDGSPPASACAAVKGMAERTRADPPLKKRIGEDIMNNLDRAHARRALPMNHAAKSVRFRMASITGSEVGRRSCWRGWRRGKPAANRYFRSEEHT